MAISIIYGVSLILLFISFFLVRKSSKKMNLIFSFILECVFIFCYNTIFSYLMNLLHIPITLITLSIMNTLISIFLLYKIKTKNLIQKYDYNKYDLFMCLLSIIIVLVIGYFRFGFPFNVVYETSDPGIHFWTSIDFMDYNQLLNHVTDNAVDFSTRQFASYTNVGILFKIFSPFIGKVHLCNIYIIFDLVTLFLSIMLFYILLRISLKRVNKVFIFIFSILYMLGYPLNNVIFGFFYSGHVINIIITFVIIYKLYSREYFNERLFLLILAILNLTIFFTYYFYVPVIYASEFIYFLHQNYKSKKKLFNKTLWLKILMILCVPTLVGVMYFVIPNIGNNDTNIITQIGLDGYYYSDVISNFILFFPFILWYFIYGIKMRTFNFEFNLLLFSIAFMIFITVLVFCNISSLYYLSKMYYLLWFIMFYIFVYVCDKLIKDNKNFIYSFFIVYIILVLNAIFGLEDIIMNKNQMEINKSSTSHILDIYHYNFDKIKNSSDNYIFTSNELKMLNEILDKKPTNVITNSQNSSPYQRIWIDALFWKEKINATENKLYDYIYREEYINLSHNNCQEVYNSKYDNFLIFYRQLNYQYYYGSDFSKYIRNDYSGLDSCIDCDIYRYDDGILIQKK